MPTIFSYTGTGTSLSLVSIQSEGVTYTYNQSAYISLISLDYGYIFNGEDLYEDYGSITNYATEVESFGKVTSSNTIPTYGLVSNIRSNTVTNFNLGVIGGIEFVLQGGAFASFGTPYIGYDLVSVSGGTQEEKAIFNYIGSGSLFEIVELEQERITYNYNQSSRVSLTSDDYGVVTELENTSEDYGSISSPITSGNLEDYNLIRINKSELPYGIFDINSSANTIFNIGNIGSGSIFTFSSTTESTAFTKDASGLFKIVGTVKESFGEGLYTGSGSLFGFSGAAERVTFSYNESSVVTRSDDDYGVTSNTHEVSEDYGLLAGTVYLPLQRDNYGFIVDNDTRTPYGIFGINSSANTIFNIGNIGSGSIFTFSSTTESSTNVKLETTELFRITGSLVEKSTADEVGSGSLFSFSGAAEAVSLAKEASGIFKITGSLVEKSTADEVGSGSIFSFSSTTESSTNVKPETTELFKITGEAVEKFGKGLYTGSGSLFSFSGAAERVAFSYNESSVVYSESFDYGYINDIHNATDNYGLIINVAVPFDQRLDYGLITTSTESNTPYGFISIKDNANTIFNIGNIGSGSIFSFSSTTESSTNVKLETTELFKITGSLVEKSTADEVGSGSLFSFSGAAEAVSLAKEASGIFKITGTVKESFSEGVYTGSGSIFAFSSTTESSTNVKLETTELFRITGSLVEKSTADEVGSGSLFGFSGAAEAVSLAKEASGIFKITGSLVEKSIANYVGSGSIFTFSSTTESSTNVKPETTELFKITGSLVEKSTADEVGSGSLFGFSGAAERVAFSYNESSVVTRSDDDYRLITNTYDISEDYGFLTGTVYLPSQKDNYGFIVDNDTRIPYGKLKITSEPIEKSIANYVGSGSLFGFSGAAEAVSLAKEASGIFKITGSLVEKSTADEVGSGSLFGFSGAAERVTFSYNESSVVTSLTEFLDYGFINNVHTSEDNYGSIIENTFSASQKEDYGFLVSNVVTKLPYGSINLSGTFNIKKTDRYVGSGSIFTIVRSDIISTFFKTGSGTINISGTVTESFGEGLYSGSGSIFAFSSTTESSTNVKPETTELFKITGSLVEKSTADEVGSGSIFSFSSTAESSTNVKPETTELFKITGSLVEKSTADEVGSGSIFSFSSTAESSTNVKPETTELFRITGSLVEKSTADEVGSGSIFISGRSLTTPSPKQTGGGTITIFDSSAESISPTTYIASGSAFTFLNKIILDSTGKQRYASVEESTTNIPPVFGTGMSLSGRVLIFFQYIETGSGTLSIRGNAIAQPSAKHISSGKFQISGSANESTVPAPHIGSGTISNFSSTTESTSSVIPETTELFKITGAATDIKSTSAHTGQSELRLTGKAKVVIKPIHLGLGRIRINGLGQESTVPAPHIGSGSIFTFVSSTESTSSVIPETTELFKITGAATDIKSTNSEVGSGSLFTFVSDTETATFAKEASGLFRFSGTLEESFTKGLYIGEGVLTEFSYRSILDSTGKVRFISVDESASFVPRIEAGLLHVNANGLESKSIPYIGSGSLLGFVSKTESTSSAEKSKVLFRISGTSIERFNNSYEGSGTVFAFVGSAESSTTNIPKTVELFKISGSAEESITPRGVIGNASAQINAFSTENSTISEISFVQSNIFGELVERSLFAHTGSGILRNLNSAAIVSANIYRLTTILLTIFGSAGESFSRPTYNGSGTTFISVNSRDIKVDFDPPKPSQIQII